MLILYPHLPRKYNFFGFSLPQSASLTAPSSEGAFARMMPILFLNFFQQVFDADVIELSQSQKIGGGRVWCAVFPFADSLPADAQMFSHKFLSHFLLLLPLHLLLFPALAICWYILSGAKLVTFSVRHQGYTSFVVRVATFVASSRFIYISLNYFTKKIFLFLLPFGAYSPSHAQSILPSVKYSPSQVQSILRRKRVLFFKNLVVTLPEYL